MITKPNLSTALTVRCHRDPDANATVWLTGAPTGAGALRSGFGSGVCRGHWLELNLGKGDRTGCECKHRESKNKFRYCFHYAFFSCASEPFAHGFTLREEGQVELLGETPNGLSASATLRNCENAVNTICALPIPSSRESGQIGSAWLATARAARRFQRGVKTLGVSLP